MKPAEICIFIWPLNDLFLHFSFSPLTNVKLAFDGVFLSLSSSQWQHEQQGGAVVLLWGSGAGGHDPRTDLLPEEILWSAESRIKTLNINTLSPWFTSFTNWTSNSTEIRRTWLFASPQVFLFSFAPLVNLFIVCFGKGCKFGNKLIHWFCFSPTCVHLFGSGIFLFFFFFLLGVFSPMLLQLHITTRMK